MRLTIGIKFTIMLLVAIVEYQPVAAIKCYVCQSNIDPKCADPFDNLTLPITDCDAYPRADLVPRTELEAVEERGFLASFGLPAPVKPIQATMCRKIRQKVNGDWRTIRGCGYLGSPGDGQNGLDNICNMKHGHYDTFAEVCTCNSKDGCNGAQVGAALSSSLAAVVIFASSIFVLYANQT